MKTSHQLVIILGIIINIFLFIYFSIGLYKAYEVIEQEKNLSICDESLGDDDYYVKNTIGDPTFDHSLNDICEDDLKCRFENTSDCYQRTKSFTGKDAITYLNYAFLWILSDVYILSAVMMGGLMGVGFK